MMKNNGTLLILFFCCQVAAAFQSEPVSSDLREVVTSDFLTFAVDKNHTDSQVVLYWIEHVQREIRQINSGRFNGSTIYDPEVLERLEEAMSPIRKVESELRGLRGEEFRIKASELQAASSDPAIANETFEILGKEHATYMIKERVVEVMTCMERSQVGDWSTFGTVLKNENFHTFLKLSESQKQQLARELADSVSKLAGDLAPLMRRLGSIWHSRWDKILDVLNGDQRAIASKLVGKPVDWFRVPKTGKLQPDGDAWVATYITYCGSKMGQVLKDKEISQYSTQELDGGGIELFNSVVYEMLYAEALWDEYELVDDQRNKLAKSIRKHLNENALVLPERPERIDELMNQKADYPDTVKELLLPNQMEWFRQIELQILLGRKYDSSVGLLNPKMANFLHLTETQKREIDKIVKEFEANVAEVLQQVTSQRAVAQTEFASRLMQILSKDQVAKLETSTGKSLGFIDK